MGAREAEGGRLPTADADRELSADDSRRRPAPRPLKRAASWRRGLAASTRPLVSRAVLRAGCVLAAVLASPPESGLAQQAQGAVNDAAPEAPGGDESAGPEGDVLGRRRLWQFMYQVRTAPGADLNGNPVTTTTDTWKLRADEVFALNTQWSIALRGDLTFRAKDKYTDANPNGDFLYGFGDPDVQAALIDTLSARWTAGAGVRLIAPIGDPEISSRLWRVMPIAAVRYALPEISPGSYFEPLVRYDVSFAGDPTQKFVSNLQFAPTLNLSLPGRWFFTLYPSPEIRWNFGAPITGQTGRLFLPFDARIGKKFNDFFNASIEVSVPIVKQYPVYNFMTALRINYSF